MTDINTLAAPTNPAAATELARSMQKISNALSFILFTAPRLTRHKAILVARKLGADLGAKTRCVRSTNSLK